MLHLVAAAMLLAPPTRTVVFETDEVTEAAVAVFPDGKTLAFTMLGHLFRIPAAAGGTAEQLTFGPYFDGDPAISPDGSKIAFVSDRAAREGFELAVYVLDLSTKQVRRLTDDPLAFRPSFAASGDAIDYIAVPREPAMPGATLLREVGIAGGAPRTLRDRPAPYRSLVRLADGKLAWSVAEFDRATGAATSRVETVGEDGQVRTLASTDGSLERVEASPSGDGLYARRTKGGGRLGAPQTEDLVFIADGAVRSIAPLETKSGPRPRIAVMPSGSTIVLGDAGRLVKIDARSAAREILPMRARVTLELEPATPPRVAPRPAPVIASPLPVPGGGLIFEAAGWLWAQPPSDGPARRLEDRGAGPHAMAVSPALSADGKRLAFVRVEGLEMTLCTMDLATG